MRTLAEILFWTGRIEFLVAILLVVHVLFLWVFRHQPLASWLTAGWLILFLVLSLTVLYPVVVGPASAGTDDIITNLYGGLWSTDGEALSNILSHWQSVWLPIYIPWLILWAVGLTLVLAALAVVEGIMAAIR